MSVIPVINPGMSGIQKGIADAQQSAASIASADQFTAENPSAIATSLVQIKEAQIQIEASAKAVQADNESIGVLLDEYA